MASVLTRPPWCAETPRSTGKAAASEGQIVGCFHPPTHRLSEQAFAQALR
jgi:hypothetical protein